MTVVQRALAVLERIAPLRLADAAFDNVGLLLEPPPLVESPHVLLTIDLTEEVLDEALEARASLIVAYHPPWFRSEKRLTMASASHRVIMRCLQAGVAVYSPHTALDSVRGGINDWIAAGLGASPADVRPLEASRLPGMEDCGMGRLLVLATPLSLSALCGQIKALFGLACLRAANYDGDRLVQTVAIAAGSGGSVFASARTRADVYLTGEMSHHGILALVHDQGGSVILTEHSNCERGYLAAVLAPRLREALPDLVVSVSRRDRDPVRTI